MNRKPLITLRPFGKFATEPFTALYASDLAGRAQAFQKLVAGGVAVESALAMSGLMGMDEAA